MIEALRPPRAARCLCTALAEGRGKAPNGRERKQTGLIPSQEYVPKVSLAYHEPVLGIEAQGSAAGRALPS